MHDISRAGIARKEPAVCDRLIVVIEWAQATPFDRRVVFVAFDHQGAGAAVSDQSVGIGSDVGDAVRSQVPVVDEKDVH